MGIFNFLKGEFLEVIQWEDETTDTMVYKFPVPAKQQIKEGAQLIVRPSQVAVFVYQGQIADIYEPGKYSLDTDSMPILTTLSNWKYLFKSHFTTDVYFVNTKQFINQKWGTSNPVMMRDPEFGLIRLRAFGVYSFRVGKPVEFLKEVFGTNTMYTVDSVNEHLKSIVVSGISDTLGEQKIAAIDLAAQYFEIGKMVQDKLQERFGLFGLEVADFSIENVSLPESVEKAIDKRTEMGAIGNLDTYMKYQTAEALRDAAKNEGGMAGIGAGMGAGMGIGQVMAQSMQPQQQQYQQPQQQPQAPVQPQQQQYQQQSPAQPGQAPMQQQPPVQQQQAPAQPQPQQGGKFCTNCRTPLNAGAKFCGECGTPVAG